MNEVNKTLYIPLYGKTQISKKAIILHDPMAERIPTSSCGLFSKCICKLLEFLHHLW